MRFLVLAIQLACDGVDKGEARGCEMRAASEAFHTPVELPVAGITENN
jgi:hypothetical protein